MPFSQYVPLQAFQFIVLALIEPPFPSLRARFISQLFDPLPTTPAVDFFELNTLAWQGNFDDNPFYPVMFLPPGLVLFSV